MKSNPDKELHSLRCHTHAIFLYAAVDTLCSDKIGQIATDVTKSNNLCLDQ